MAIELDRRGSADWHALVVIIEETVTYLEMTSPDQLVPGVAAPYPVGLEKVDRTSATLVGQTYARIGEPHGWIGRLDWSFKEWKALVGRPEIHIWLARVGREVGGLVELEVQADAEVEIATVGLVPAFVGRGFGGQLVTLATRLAWEIDLPGAGRTRRVWLHTSSRDHPNALATTSEEGSGYSERNREGGSSRTKNLNTEVSTHSHPSVPSTSCRRA